MYNGEALPPFESARPAPDQDLSAWVPPMFEDLGEPGPAPAPVLAQAVADEPAVPADGARPERRGRQRDRGNGRGDTARPYEASVPPASYPAFVPDRSVTGSLPGRLPGALPADASTEAALGGFLPGPGGGMPNRRGPVVASTGLVLFGWLAHSVVAWRRRPRYQPA